MDVVPLGKVYSAKDVAYSDENEGFLEHAPSKVSWQKRRFYSLSHILVLYAMIATLLTLVAILSFPKPHQDHGIALWSPANTAVSYIKTQNFRAALFNQTEYMGYPTEDGKTDELWSNLYNFGISKISREEAAKLHNPTVKAPGTDDYLIELDVWHELHCLNDLRKILYPEVYGGLSTVTFRNGTINRDTDAFRYWDHCVDSLRQALMCHADVSPIPFHVNIPANTGIFPRLATTHTCRDFTKIQAWAKEHWAGEWDFKVNKEQAQRIIDASGFDHSPGEDIQFLYKLFPGNKWFKFWRDHDVLENK